MTDAIPRLYDELASWFHLLTAPEDYAEEAAWVAGALDERLAPSARTVLELGSGGGNLASHLKARYELTLTNLSPKMLALSRTLNPTCEHLPGDMRSLRLDREFDAVVIHDAITYLTTVPEIESAAATAFAHLRPGGVLVALPDCVRETFEPSTECGGHDDERDGRGLRYVEWSWDPDPSDTSYEVAYAYVLRESDGTTRAVHDRHRCGLFERSVWMDVLRGAGLEVECRRDPWGRDDFIGVRPL